jgi:hypothetical protein
MISGCITGATVWMAGGFGCGDIFGFAFGDGRFATSGALGEQQYALGGSCHVPSAPEAAGADAAGGLCAAIDRGTIRVHGTTAAHRANAETNGRFTG